MVRIDRKINWLISVCLFLITSCVTAPSEPPRRASGIERSLPQSKLAFYNDPFDKLREDLWDRAGYVNDKNKLARFKEADIRIENGKLMIETQIGHFSKGGLASKYTLKGDFDAQVDCQIEFIEGRYDMDQVVHFVVFDKTKEVQNLDGVIIGLFKSGKSDSSMVFSGVVRGGLYSPGDLQKIGNFRGTLKIVRVSDKISTLYKIEGSTEWKKINTFQSTTNKVMIGFKLQNYAGNRGSITARLPVSAFFDNFIINSAQSIEEEEI